MMGEAMFCFMILLFALTFYGEPDLHDALVKYAMQQSECNHEEE